MHGHMMAELNKNFEELREIRRAQGISMSEIQVIDNFLNEEDFKGLKEFLIHVSHGLSVKYYLKITYLRSKI